MEVDDSWAVGMVDFRRGGQSRQRGSQPGPLASQASPKRRLRASACQDGGAEQLLDDFEGLLGKLNAVLGDLRKQLATAPDAAPEQNVAALSSLGSAEPEPAPGDRRTDRVRSSTQVRPQSTPGIAPVVDFDVEVPGRDFVVEAPFLMDCTPSVGDVESALQLESAVVRGLSAPSPEDADVPRSGWVFNPHGRIRNAHDLLSVIVLSFDVLFLPLVLAWEELAEKPWLQVLNTVSILFWVFDIGMSFNTAIYVNGLFVANRRTIALNYIRTWFLPDFLVSSVDVINLTIDAPKKGSGMLRATKISRALRLSRFVRMAKINDGLCRIADRFGTDVVDIVLGISKPLFVILVINHLLACGWFMTANLSSPDTGFIWLDERVIAGSDMTYRDVSITYQYFTCLHWSISQMTPGSMQVFPHSTAERVVNVGCLLVGMLAFSSIISSLTAKVSERSNLKRVQMENFNALRRFLRRSMVNPCTAVIIERAAAATMSKKYLKPVVAKDIVAVKMLPSSLQWTLSNELCRKHLTAPFFRLWMAVDSAGVGSLCHEGIGTQAFGAGDFVLLPRAVADVALVLTQGSVRYRRANGALELPALGHGTLLCEPALWVKWQTFGEALATTGTVALAISAQTFGSIVMRQGVFRFFAAEFGFAYALWITSTVGEPRMSIEVQVNRSMMEVILPSLSFEARLISGMAALHVQKERARLKFFHSEGPLDELREEVLRGSSILMLDDQGELVRAVALQAFEITNDHGEVLVQMGRVTASGVKADVKLPGGKQSLGETAAVTRARVLGQKLPSLAEHLDEGVSRLEVEVQTSRSKKLSTRYVRTVTAAKLQAEAPGLPAAEWASGVESKSSLQRGTSSFSSALPRAATAAARLASHDRQALEPPEMYHGGSPEGPRLLFAWLPQEQLEWLRSSEGEQHLQAWFDGRALVTSQVEEGEESAPAPASPRGSEAGGAAPSESLRFQQAFVEAAL